jgi:hypothetical protein
MDERSRLYFDRLFSDSRNIAYISEKPHNYDSMPSLMHIQGRSSAAPIAKDDVNFQAWLVATVGYIVDSKGSDSERLDSWTNTASPIASKRTTISENPGTVEFSGAILLPPADGLVPKSSDMNSAVVTVLDSDSANASLDIVAGIDEGAMEMDQRELPLNASSFCSHPMKPINASASNFTQSNNISKPAIPTLLLDSQYNQRHPPYSPARKYPGLGATDGCMDTNDFSVAHSPSIQRCIRRQSFSARPARLRTFSAGGGM